MADVHLSCELLDAMFDGENRDPGELIPVVLSHLFDLCPECAEAFEAWQDSISVTAALSYEEVTSAAVERGIEALDRVREEEGKAQGYLDAILAKPAEDRASFVEAAPEGVRGPALASGLIEAAKEAMPRNPHDSLALARLARTVLQHADLSPFVEELYARAVAYVGNAMRVLGNLSEAAEVMAHARFILRQAGNGDEITQSELDNLEGMVRLHQRDYAGAERLLKRAMTGFRCVGHHREGLRSGLILAILYRESGDLKKAISTQRQINEELEKADEPQLLIFGHRNLVVALCDAGQYGEAEEWFEKTVPFLKGDIAISRAEWVQGRIAHGQGDLERAESHLKAAQYGFNRVELHFDKAMVTLELACLYLGQSRWEEVRALANEVVEVFEGQERQQE